MMNAADPESRRENPPRIDEYRTTAEEEEEVKQDGVVLQHGICDFDELG